MKTYFFSEEEKGPGGYPGKTKSYVIFLIHISIEGDDKEGEEEDLKYVFATRVSYPSPVTMSYPIAPLGPIFL